MVVVVEYARARSCPVCGGVEKHRLPKGDRHGLGIRYAVCTSCTHVFIDPPPTDDWLTSFYEDSYRTLYNASDAPDSHYLSTHTPEHMGASGLADLLRLPDDPVVLDVGCAEGHLLAQLRERYPNAELWGLEPSQAFLDYACGHVPGMRGEAGMIDSAALPEHHFDAVAAIHVLEHAKSPGDFLIRARQLLKPGGLVLLEVPAGGGPSWRNKNFHVAHLHQFTQRSLVTLVDKAGFRIDDLALNARRADDGSLTLLAAAVEPPVDNRNWLVGLEPAERQSKRMMSEVRRYRARGAVSDSVKRVRALARR